MEKSDRAFGQITSVLSRLIQKEIAAYRQSATIAKEPLSMENLENLNWWGALSEAEEAMPLVWMFLTNILCPKSRLSRIDIHGSSMGKQVPAMGFLLFTALYSRFPQHFKFFPSLNSVMLFKHGNSHAVSIFSIIA